VTIVGTQSNLSDSSNGSAAVQNAVTQWKGVPKTDIRYSGPTTSGLVTVKLDATMSFDNGVTFSTPLPCGSGGVLGLGGVQRASSASPGGYTYQGDSHYFAIQNGIVTIRQRTGAPGCYPVNIYTTEVLHEVGHTLGLGHSDKAQSIHSTTSSTDQLLAVMNSALPAAHPSAPQKDDIQAIQFYYGVGLPTTPTVTPTPTPTSPPTTPTPTPTSGFSRGHVTPLKFVTPRSDVLGRQ
jgi:hypothetical protein